MKHLFGLILNEIKGLPECCKTVFSMVKIAIDHYRRMRKLRRMTRGMETAEKYFLLETERMKREYNKSLSR